ncbi:alpha/beta hydrolase [Mycobacterium sp. ACS1612]|uniref:alpha/beta hydrolase n=1 Tax=Mycobacterium sp. ACS1612 TaxID=1834117 RepID=UPI0007FF3942|nr:alpha/beta hydrolase [Mycobacterium sp. ACS1612]OBF28355.1 alpha/beta hydrolase [Mycobacterium sp. ACS1612]
MASPTGNTSRVSTEFHPDLRRVARHIPRQIITPATVPFLRASERLLWRRTPKDVEVLTLASGVGIRLFRPAGVSGPMPALLWIHGGGYVIGKAAQDDALCRRYAREVGAIVASVDYRLAPEHPYPASLEDCYSALRWLVRLPSVDPDLVAIGGASAGGGLAAALALLTRDRGEIPLAAQLLVYPMLDDRTVGRHHDHPGLRLWNQSSNKYGWSAYLGGADPEVAVPARREDLSGLPPAWLGVGTLDLFHDEDLAYAERLRAAGVRCDVEIVEGAFHGFDGIVPKADVSQRFFDSQCALLREMLTPAAA